ncbi:MAG: membrane protein insertase YidC, partial [Betaproteobacteria bacterium]
MDTQRLILFLVFSFSLLLLWDAWQKEIRPPAAPATQGAVPTPSGPAATPAAKGVEAMPPNAAPAGKPRERLWVRTDTLLAEIDTQGGDLVYLELLKHKDTHDEKKNFVLFGPEHRYSAQSGLIGAGLPNHRTLFRAAAK